MFQTYVKEAYDKLRVYKVVQLGRISRVPRSHCASQGYPLTSFCAPSKQDGSLNELEPITSKQSALLHMLAVTSACVSPWYNVELAGKVNQSNRTFIITPAAVFTAN